MKRNINSSLRILLVLYLCLPVFSGLRYAQDIPPQSPPEKAAPADTLSDWQVMQMAIAFTESRFNPDARGKAGDLGVFQITPVYVREINRLSGGEIFRHEDAADSGTSVRMFNAMQGFYNPEHDVHLAIYHHNKSETYGQTVKKNIELVNRYENFRKIILEQ